jgi:hypothetical protein
MWHLAASCYYSQAVLPRRLPINLPWLPSGYRISQPPPRKGASLSKKSHPSLNLGRAGTPCEDMLVTIWL